MRPSRSFLPSFSYFSNSRYNSAAPLPLLSVSILLRSRCIRRILQLRMLHILVNFPYQNFPNCSRWYFNFHTSWFAVYSFALFIQAIFFSRTRALSVHFRRLLVKTNASLPFFLLGSFFFFLPSSVLPLFLFRRTFFFRENVHMRALMTHTNPHASLNNHRH